MKTRWIAILAVLLVTNGCVASRLLSERVIKVQGRSMEPTLKIGDEIVISRDVAKLQRGDIVFYRYPKDESKYYIHRIVGMPGEDLEFSPGKVSVNGNDLVEPYIDPKLNVSNRSETVTVPAGNYLVLGDNRDNSNDSRFQGPLPARYIEAKYVRHVSR
jgi:signal peptidase I